MIKIIVVVDDKTGFSDLKNTHGLSLYIEFDNLYLLFDLGPSSEILQHNVDKLGIDIELLDSIIISHNHVDHFNAIPYVGWVSPFLQIYIPYDSMNSIGKYAKQNSLKPVEVIDWINPWSSVYVSKPIYGPPWEHFLVFKTNMGLIVLSGCMHPGVDKTLDTIVNYLNDQVYCIIGGFHLVNALERVVYSTIEILFNKYRVDKIAPLHCSGGLFTSILKNKYSDKYIDLHTGSSIEL
ncbi:MAG: MBL fold metallo-hydrolase [Desulfurococcaceae archaeon]|uniref:MBL fold metallo-hydrolase n=1 Tax=Staphylothermus marinus TaxID=2280 RepID=A0A7C4D950_STAMA